MARVKSPSQVKHRKVQKATKGFTQSRRTRVTAGMDALLHQGQYQYVGRKLRKRDLRSLWIIRLNAAVREEGLSYSKFISALKKSKVEIDRKILAEIAVKDVEGFKKIVSAVK
ncbi:MAG TPA: 50S ribosomal protein L20 [Candidatus Saccharimonadales bacterium]|nr:50S ribosomal protein L20 [Candidatus Saccharimonadales bacterium]